MQRARQHAETRHRQRRQQVAREAARLMVEGGHRDFHRAKLKAAARLGIDDEASLPRNEEIEEALREHQRLFPGPARDTTLRRQREAALEALEFFSAFAPRLVGPVLDGTADRHSAVLLHLHVDDADAVPRSFEDAGIPACQGSVRIRYDRDRSGVAPAWHFDADGIAFEVRVLPYSALRQAPLSVDGLPQHRASAGQLRQLLVDASNQDRSS